MKALLQYATTAVLVSAMVILPLIAFRHVVNEMTEAVPHFTSPIQEADYWLRAFGP